MLNYPSITSCFRGVWRVALAATAGLALAASPGCGSGSDSGPSQYVNLLYAVTPPGTNTGSSPLKLPVVTEVLQCQRTSKKIVVAASGGAAGITITLQGNAAAPQASLRLDKDTVSAGEVSLKLPLNFDARTFETSNPMTWVTSDRAAELSCTLSITGADPFASFDGEFSCSTLPGGTREVTASGQFHAVPCP